MDGALYLKIEKNWGDQLFRAHILASLAGSRIRVAPRQGPSRIPEVYPNRVSVRLVVRVNSTPPLQSMRIPIVADVEKNR
jgi:hypothetical protein